MDQNEINEIMDQKRMEATSRPPVSSDDPQPRPGPIKNLVLPPPHESVFRYANQRKKKPINRNAWWRVLLRILFSHVGMFILVCAWSLFGAWIFVQLELPEEENRHTLRRIRALEINDSIKYLSELFWYWQGNNYTVQKWNEEVFNQMKEFEEFVIEGVTEYEYDGSSTGWTYSWTIPNALMFSVTLITTIGYGHIAPVTLVGRIVCILYSLVGIPLLLLFLANIGDAMANAFTYSYSRFCCHWCRMRRKKSEYRKGDDTIPVPKDALKQVALEKVGPEEYMPTETVAVPIMLCLILIFVYIVAGAILFSYWEGWDLISSGYFTFITLSTIGLGDLVPGKSFNVDEDDFSFNSSLRLLATCLYCAFGMALVSMSIALMQEQLIKKVRWIATEIGFVKDTPSSENTY